MEQPAHVNAQLLGGPPNGQQLGVVDQTTSKIRGAQANLTHACGPSLGTGLPRRNRSASKSETPNINVRHTFGNRAA
eukprot:5387057-Lingulodinium_polyedra.AAC.1